MSQHLGPVLIEADQIIRLEREPLSADGKHTEAVVQTLVHKQPHLLPMIEIEPAYADMVSLCTELPLSAGFVDNLWMTPRGGIVIGECKLFRNPQARREVIAQALDYARALQTLSYEKFEASIGKARGDSAFRLWPFLSSELPESDVIDEASFIDGVSRRLRNAQIFILIIGDGIREELEDLAEFLQLHAGMHANLALVDLSLWRLPDGRRLVIPRLPLKTETILRGIVRVDTNAGTVRVSGAEPEEQPTSLSKTSPAKSTARSGSAEEYLTLLGQSDPDSASVISTLFSLTPEAGVEVRFTPQYVVFEVPSAGTSRTAFDVKVNGEIWGGNLVCDAADEIIASAIRPTLPALAAAMNAALGFTPQNYHRLRSTAGKKLLPKDFRGKESDVIEALRLISTAAARATQEGSDGLR